MPNGDLARFETELIRNELKRLLEWADLKSSPQLSKLLRYVVEAVIEGRNDELKQATLGIPYSAAPPDMTSVRTPLSGPTPTVCEAS